MVREKALEDSLPPRRNPTSACSGLGWARRLLNDEVKVE
jgi:hypothetical protein